MNETIHLGSINTIILNLSPCCTVLKNNVFAVSLLSNAKILTKLMFLTKSVKK